MQYAADIVSLHMTSIFRTDVPTRAMNVATCVNPRKGYGGRLVCTAMSVTGCWRRKSMMKVG